VYRDLAQITTEETIAASATKSYGPFTLFNTRAFLIQLKGTQVPADTELKVYLSTDFKQGTAGDSTCPIAPGLGDANTWVLIHTNDLMTDVEPLIYEKCQTAAEWLRFDVIAGSASDLEGLDIVLAKQAWR
jgi:hypothetical protein